MKNCSFCKLLIQAIDNDEYYEKPHEYSVSLVARYYHDGTFAESLPMKAIPSPSAPYAETS